MADIELEMAEQQKLIEHLKIMIREREQSLQKKDAELKESTAKISKLKLQAKAQVTKLTHQLENAKKGITPEVEASSKSKSGQEAVESTSQIDRGKTKLLQKKLEEKDKIIADKDEIIKVRESQIESKENIIVERETILLDLKEQLEQKTNTMETLQSTGQGDSGINEMYAQIVYKDKKLLELNNKILEMDRQVMDLQEYVSEKNEVISGRDKVIEILQTSLKDKDQNLQDQAMLIAKLTAKVEKSEENISLLTEQLQKKDHDLKVETDRFSLKLSESHKYFEETLNERETEVKRLQDSITSKDKDLLMSQNDLREIINRHEHDIQSIMNKGTVNIEDTVMKMMEQKIKDSNEVLEGKIKVVEIMQAEMVSKDQELIQNRETLRTLKDKLQVTSEQLLLLQANFVDMETQWKDEKAKLETKVKTLVEKHETELSEKDLQMQTFQMTLTKYETAYAQASVQYSALQERYQQAYTELKKSQEGQPPSSQPILPSSTSADTDELRKIVDILKAEMAQKTEEIESLKKASSEESNTASKPDKSETKMLKMKAQLTSKIKHLENELLVGLRQGSNLADEVVTLKNQLVELEDEKGNLQLKLVDFEEQKTLQVQLESQIKDLESEKETLNVNISELTSSLQAANDEREKLSQIVTDLQDRVDQNQVEHDHKQIQIVEDLTQQVFDLQLICKNLEAENEQVKSRCIDLEIRIEESEIYKKQTESDLSLIDQELFTTKQKLEILDQQLKNYQAELQAARKECEEQRQRYELFEQNLKSEKENLHKEIEDIRGKNIVLDGDVHFHSQDADQKQLKIKELQNIIVTKDKEIEHFQISLKEQSNSIAERDLLVKKLSRDLDIAKEGQIEKGADFEHKLQSLVSQISELESELVNQQKSYLGLQEDLTKLQSELQSTKSDCQNFKLLSSEKDNVISSLKLQLETLFDYEKSTLDQMKNEKDSHQQIENENTRLNSEIKQLESELIQSQNLSVNLSTKCDELTHLCETQNKTVTELTIELSGVKSVCSVSESALHDLKLKLEEYKLSVKNKEAEIISVSKNHLSETIELQSQNEALQIDFSTLQRQFDSEVKDLKIRLSEKEQILNQLSASVDSEELKQGCVYSESLSQSVEKLEADISSSQIELLKKSDLCSEKDSQILILNADIQESMLKVSNQESLIQKIIDEKSQAINKLSLMEQHLEEKTVKNI